MFWDIFSLIKVLVVIFIIFLLFREYSCWYFKLTKISKTLEEVRDLLKEKKKPSLSVKK